QGGVTREDRRHGAGLAATQDAEYAGLERRVLGLFLGELDLDVGRRALDREELVLRGRVLLAHLAFGFLGALAAGVLLLLILLLEPVGHLLGLLLLGLDQELGQALVVHERVQGQ